jgi:hypothetical protein
LSYQPENLFSGEYPTFARGRSIEHHSAVRDFYDKDELRRIYYPEAEQLLQEVISSSGNYLLLKFLPVPASPRPRVSPNDKSSDKHDITGAFKVVVFNHTLRNAQQSQQSNGAKEPVKRVHNDFTAKSGYTR